MSVEDRVVAAPELAPVHAWWALSRHAVRAFVRNPVAAFFTVAFPLAFLVLVASIVGDARTPEGVPVAQFLVAPFAVFGVAQAAFTSLAVDTAVLREQGTLSRLRGSPAPPAAVLGARISAAVVASLTAVLLLAGTGVAFYGVRIVWHKVPALVVTLLLGITCLASLGLALTSLTRTVLAVQTLSQGLLIPLAFISDVFIVGARLPRFLEVTGSVLPLKHFARALSGTFDPGAGSGFATGHLVVLALWTVAGAAVALRRFGWSPRGRATGPPPVAAAGLSTTLRLPVPRDAGRPSIVALLGGQIRYALLGLRRDLLSVFFAVVFPVLLLVLFPAVFGDEPVHGLAMAQYLLAAMITYAVAVAGYVNLAESVAGARAQGVLRRLRGTPLPAGLFVAGRVLSALLVGLLSAAALSTVAVTTLDVRLEAGRIPAVLLGVVLGVVCFAALGLAVVALLPSARSVVGITLGTLLPLSFVSEVFVVGPAPMPAWLAAVGDVFPLRHLLELMLAATRPGPFTGPIGTSLAIVVSWTAAAILITVVRFRRGRRD